MSARLLPAELDRALAAHVAFLGQRTPNGKHLLVKSLDGARGVPTRAQAAQARNAA